MGVCWDLGLPTSSVPRNARPSLSGLCCHAQRGPLGDSATAASFLATKQDVSSLLGLGIFPLTVIQRNWSARNQLGELKKLAVRARAKNNAQKQCHCPSPAGQYRRSLDVSGHCPLTDDNYLPSGGHGAECVQSPARSQCMDGPQ